MYYLVYVVALLLVCLKTFPMAIEWLSWRGFLNSQDKEEAMATFLILSFIVMALLPVALNLEWALK